MCPAQKQRRSLLTVQSRSLMHNSFRKGNKFIIFCIQWLKHFFHFRRAFILSSWWCYWGLSYWSYWQMPFHITTKRTVYNTILMTSDPCFARGKEMIIFSRTTPGKVSKNITLKKQSCFAILQYLHTENRPDISKSFKILSTSSERVDLLISESLHIRKIKPFLV